HIAIDKAGNILACSWAVSGDKTTHYAASYRWRDPSGIWGELKTLSGGLTWSTMPKVQEYNGDFYILYQGGDWHVAGPVKPGGSFSTNGLAVHATSIGAPVLNEGAYFHVVHPDTMIFASAMRFNSGCGVMVGFRKSSTFDNPVNLGIIDGTSGYCESMMHPDVVVDKATGAVVVTIANTNDSSGHYYVYENDSWSTIQNIYDDEWGRQYTDRTGPNVADLPGRGVVICFRHNDNIYLRKLVTEGELLIDSVTSVSNFSQKNTPKRNFLRYLENGASLSPILKFQGETFNHITIKDLNGKVVGVYNYLNSQPLKPTASHFPSGLYIINRR
ncbi:MAG: hypothetical protein HQK83_18780, partial [Fibrobacteria bacterium]|nr:hypothetical protein [Fibrobacteria bacterium]